MRYAFRPMKLGIRLATAALAVILACSRSRSDPGPPPSTPTPTTPTPTPAPLKFAWPPVIGQEYPDLSMHDRTGAVVQLSSFRGRVILLEPIGMSCPACQAFCGAHRKGPLGAVTPQKGLLSIEEYFAQYTGGVPLIHPRLAYIQLLLYSPTMSAPTAADVGAWADHFGNPYVFAAGPELLGTASFNLIPGFQLIDRNFVLRLDSTGHHPRHNLFTDLLPRVADLMSQ